MPDSLHPPYGVTQPRQLNRWLDVNSQNGPLKRTQKFITLPDGIILAKIGLTVSDRLCQYNCSIPNNISLKIDGMFGREHGQLDDRFCWCVRDSAGNFYKLNEAGQTFSPIQYTGQKLVGPFLAIEVYQVVQTDLEVTSVKILTSLRGNVDYRYGNDAELNGDSLPYLFFNYNQTSTGTFDLPLTFDNNVSEY